MTALRLVVVGVAVAVLGLAQDFSAAVDASHRGDAMDERRVREIVREELAKILSRLPEPNNDPHPAEKDSSLIGPAVPAPSPLTPAETDANLIERARRIALTYTENLPNFVCTKTERSGWSKDDARSRWRQSREVTAEVQFVDRRESYRNVTINGRRSKKNFRQIANYGEFGRLLYVLFRPESGAAFTRSGDDVIGGREVAVFRMELANPRYGYTMGPKKFGFQGRVSIDKATGRVLRYDAREMLGIPSDYPFQQASHSIDYGYVPIGGKESTCCPCARAGSHASPRSSNDRLHRVDQLPQVWGGVDGGFRVGAQRETDDGIAFPDCGSMRYRGMILSASGPLNTEAKR